MEDWEKDLRKKKNVDALIINRPEALHNVRRKAEVSITTVGWIVWIFLCRPALLAMLWLIGFRFFFKHMIDLGGLTGLQELKYVYISVIVFIVLLIRGWNMYNKVRYGKKKRRSTAKGVTEDRLEKSFKLPQNSVQKLRNMKDITVDFLGDHKFHVKDSQNTGNQYDGHFKPT